MLPKLLGETSQRLRPALSTRVREMIERNSRDAIAGALEAMMSRPDSRSLLNEISVPTLVVVGEEDSLTPVSDSESIHEAIDRSHLVVLPGAGHLSNLEVPDDFSEVLENFLTSNL